MRHPFRILFCLWALLAPLTTAAQTPEEIVHWVYGSLVQPGPAESRGLAYLSAPAQRASYFTRRMQAFYSANETHGADLASACVDFALEIPGQDFDAAEIARSLTVTRETAGTGSGNRLTVTARFTNFGQPAAIAYDFAIEDGFWRIDDIAGPGWRVSQIPCTARAAMAGGVCYEGAVGRLKIEPTGDGRATVHVDSWQVGHHCGLQGTAIAMQTGWVLETMAGDTPCRLTLERTADGGLRLGDAGRACSRYHCGMRASLDGLGFSAAERADCAGVRIDW